MTLYMKAQLLCACAQNGICCHNIILYLCRCLAVQSKLKLKLRYAYHTKWNNSIDTDVQDNLLDHRTIVFMLQVYTNYVSWRSTAVVASYKKLGLKSACTTAKTHPYPSTNFSDKTDLLTKQLRTTGPFQWTSLSNLTLLDPCCRLTSAYSTLPVPCCRLT